jgi:hypothetical protein
MALILLVICFITFNIFPHLISFIFISLAAITTLYLLNKWTLNTTPSHGFLLLDCKNHYLEIHADTIVSGHIIAAELMFSVLSLKIKDPLSKRKTVNFVASSMTEQDWKRLCRVALLQEQKER